jgi:hypothetical protein
MKREGVRKYAFLRFHYGVCGRDIHLPSYSPVIEIACVKWAQS